MFCLTIVNLFGYSQVKKATYWTSPNIPKGIEQSLAAHDLIIIDYENLFNASRSRLETIKAINPQIIVLVYSNPMEIWDKDLTDRPMANKLKSSFNATWQLKTANKKSVVFWPGMLMMNMTTKSPRVNNKTYSEFYVDWLIKNVLQDKLIDGYFMDNGTATVSWISPLIDADNDGKADQASALDSVWREGMVLFLKTIRQKMGDSFIIVTNKGIRDFAFINNGVMFEKFPNDYIGHDEAGGWYQSIENARRNGKFNIFQVDLQHIEFGITSSLLLDNVYVAAGQNIPLQQKYYFDTGASMGNFYKKNGKYYRNFENGTVEVDPEKKIGKFLPK